MIADVDNLYINIGGYFELSFVMAEVGNLHAKLGGSHGLHTWFTCFTWFAPLGPQIVIVR
jgi:hypothetical protein